MTMNNTHVIYHAIVQIIRQIIAPCNQPNLSHIHLGKHWLYLLTIWFDSWICKLLYLSRYDPRRKSTLRIQINNYWRYKVGVPPIFGHIASAATYAFNRPYTYSPGCASRYIFKYLSVVSVCLMSLQRVSGMRLPREHACTPCRMMGRVLVISRRALNVGHLNTDPEIKCTTLN